MTKIKEGLELYPMLRIQFNTIKEKLIDVIEGWKLMPRERIVWNEETMEEKWHIPSNITAVLDKHEKELGHVALLCIQQIIKLKFYKARGHWDSTCENAFLMDGNGDNYNEYEKIGKDNPVLRDLRPVSDKDWLLNTAKRLLRYGS
tara:strand:- start:2489 stop:2926 length:438 start_codon:yes stop_codon:yes gene_type:complete